jgi:AhpD family alkylhydroperoxidase
MEPRLNLAASPVAAKAMQHFGAASMAIITQSTLPAAIRNMVMLRSSQINGCGYCTDIHAKDLEHDEEPSVRINLVATWRHSTVFTDAERAALELTEQGTRLADSAVDVTDEVWANAAKHFDEDQLATLVVLIGLINASNRMAVMNGMEGGSYQPGQFGY